MAEKKKAASKKTGPKVVRAKQTVRERSQTQASAKPRRLRRGVGRIGSKAKSAALFGGREYNLPLPDNKLGRILNKRVRLMPAFLGNSWSEIRQVKWPNRRETWRLTFAVLVFSLIFGISISLLDAGLDKIFKEVIIKK